VAKKPAAKKAVTKKPAAKKAVAKKPAAKQPVAKKPSGAAAKVASTPKAATKAVAVKPPESSDVKFRNLFDAFKEGKLPREHGYIVSSFFRETTAYAIYEIVSYAGVKEIYPTEHGLQFVAGGKKLYVLIENATYNHKPVEPVSRAQGDSIPKRFSELEKITAHNQTIIFVAKEPDELNSSFTVLKPNLMNFAIVFYQMPEIYDSLTSFFERSLNLDRKIPQADAKKASKLIVDIIRKSMGFEGAFK
jgi:hypothetical protein